MESAVTFDLVKAFEASEEATRDARKRSETARDYYDNKQWTDAEIAKLKSRKQPVVTYNRIQRKVNYLTGLEKQARKDPKCFPRTPGDEVSAQAATDALRFTCDETKWDGKRSAATKNLIIEGTGAIMIGVKQTKEGIDPDAIYIPWDRFWYDCHSNAQDFSDATYMGIVTWMDEAEALAKFQGKDEIITSTIDSARNSDTYDDRPKQNLWADYKRRRVRIIEGYYLIGGTWHMCIATKAGQLVESAPSPYLDEQGQPECPIKAISLYVDRDNNRYGEVDVMISPQDEINKRRSKGLHLATMRQSRISRAAGVDGDILKNTLADPQGVVIADKDEFEILPTSDMEAANFQMMQEAKAEIDLLGPNAALQGKNENDMSGRAILAQQQGGMVEVANIMDAIRELSLAVYRSMWARIRQFWDAPRWIRVTDDERNLRFVGLNQPITVADLAQKVMQGDQEALQDAHEFLGKINPQLPQILDAAMQGGEEAARLIQTFVQMHAQETVKIDNPVAELDVDIVIDEGMDTPTVQAEQFDTLAKVLPTAVNLPPPYLKALIMASSLRDKDKLIDEVEKASQGPQIPPELQQQMEQMMQALQEQGQQVQELQQALKDKGTEHQLKAAEVAQRDQEQQLEAYRAQTERMDTLKPEQQAA